MSVKLQAFLLVLIPQFLWKTEYCYCYSGRQKQQFAVFYRVASLKNLIIRDCFKCVFLVFIFFILSSSVFS